jgi:dihydroxy-acid dehydratase
MVGHVAPEAARGGPIALLRDDDAVRIDAARRELSTNADLASRRAHWHPPEPKATRGALAKYAYLVGSASEGAITQAGHRPQPVVHPSPSVHHPSEEGVTA